MRRTTTSTTLHSTPRISLWMSWETSQDLDWLIFPRHLEWPQRCNGLNRSIGHNLRTLTGTSTEEIFSSTGSTVLKFGIHFLFGTVRLTCTTKHTIIDRELSSQRAFRTFHSSILYRKLLWISRVSPVPRATSCIVGPPEDWPMLPWTQLQWLQRWQWTPNVTKLKELKQRLFWTSPWDFC